MKIRTFNRPFKTCFLFFLIAALSSVAFSQAAASPQTQITEIEVNGLKVLIKRRPGTPTVAAGLFLRGGVRNLTAQNAGIENLMLDAAIEGSKNFPSQTLRKELARTGSVISSGSNYDNSVVSMISTKQNFERSWEIFTDVTLNPAFLPADVTRTKEKILTGLRSQSDSPESYLEILQANIIYAKHPYENSPDGTITTVTKLTPFDLATYHKNVMQTSRLLLVVVGDVDVAALQKKISDSFGKLPRGEYKNVLLPPIDFSKPTLDTSPRTLETNYVKGVFAAPTIGDPDYYAMRVAIAILQQQVFQEVRVQRNLSYAPGADMNGFAANSAYISVSAVNANEAVRVMLGVIDGLRNKTVPQETIEEMGNFFLTTYYLKQETNAAQAGELASYELNGGGWQNSQAFLDKMRQVTPADVRNVANKYMKNIRFVVVGNPASVDKKIFLPAAE
jgi:zinc protease